MPSEDEVRDLVARIVDGVLAPGATAADPDASEPRDQRDAGAGDASAPSGLDTIAIGADHGGYALKERLGFKLRERGHEVIDCGTGSTESVDYPDFAHAVAKEVATGAAGCGIIIDGAGIGSSMVANKVPGVRAALCYDISSARNSREHNHANVLTLGAGLVGDGLAWQIVQEWLAMDWGGDRHARRVDKITQIEQSYFEERP